MDRHPGSAADLGALVRATAPLTTTEAVALIHDVCRQVKDGLAGAIPRDASELSIGDHGIVMIHAPAPRAHAGAAVAQLLDSLLPPPTSETAPVPEALRTLSTRLRSSTASDSNALGDLLVILRWYLDDEPQQILERLAHRLGFVEPTPYDDPFVDQFTDMPAPTTRAVAAAAAAATGVAAPRRSHARALWAAAVLLPMLSGYVGYRMSARPQAGIAPAAAAASTAAPRIVTAARAEPARAPSSPRVQLLALNISDGAFSPSFSADGTALFFHRGRDRGELMQTALNDSTRALRPVLDDAAHNFHARPSPDGRLIAFDSDRDGTRAVYVMDRDQRTVRRISGDGFAAVPSWSPDMRWLAFVRAEASRPRVWNLWLANLASGELKRLSAFRSGQVWSASWFRDGRAICYSHDDQLIVADLTNGRSRTFPTPVAGRLTRTPAVSPDGSRVVFQVLGDGVWMLELSNGAMHRILDDGTAEEFAWDPRGQRIAYHSRHDGRWQIWLMTL